MPQSGNDHANNRHTNVGTCLIKHQKIQVLALRELHARDHLLARRAVRGVEAELGEALVLADELRRRIGEHREKARELLLGRRLLQVLDDVVGHAAVDQDLEGAARTAAGDAARRLEQLQVFRERGLVGFAHRIERRHVAGVAESRDGGVDARRRRPRLVAGGRHPVAGRVEPE